VRSSWFGGDPLSLQKNSSDTTIPHDPAEPLVRTNGKAPGLSGRPAEGRISSAVRVQIGGGTTLETNITAAVFARGGSKGLPGKNLRLLGGKTLLSLAIEHALALDAVSEVYVSTDSLDIAKEAEKAGAIVPYMRPADLARDDSPEWASWRHLIEFLSQTKGSTTEYLLAVPTTAPLRITEDIEGCMRVAMDDDSLDGAICVTPSRRNPDFNMARLGADGTIDLAAGRKNSSSPYRRQDAEVLYEIVPAAYIMRTDFVRSADSMWAGKIGGYVVPEERSADIDSEFDFRIAEFLYSSRSSGSG
jgi:N,N'-diacetyl-8-epilegionaminate cytidylyltransferase